MLSNYDSILKNVTGLFLLLLHVMLAEMEGGGGLNSWCPYSGALLLLATEFSA